MNTIVSILLAVSKICSYISSLSLIFVKICHPIDLEKHAFGAIPFEDLENLSLFF